MFRKSRSWTLPEASSLYSLFCSCFVQAIIILHSHLQWGRTSGPLPYEFPNTILYPVLIHPCVLHVHPLLSPHRPTSTDHEHNIRNLWHNLPNILWLPTPLRPNIILFSNTLNLDSWNTLAIGMYVRGIVCCVFLFSRMPRHDWVLHQSSPTKCFRINSESRQVNQSHSWRKQQIYTFCNIIPFRTHKSSDSCAWLCILATWSHSVSTWHPYCSLCSHSSSLLLNCGPSS